MGRPERDRGDVEGRERGSVPKLLNLLALQRLEGGGGREVPWEFQLQPQSK